MFAKQINYKTIATKSELLYLFHKQMTNDIILMYGRKFQRRDYPQTSG